MAKIKMECDRCEGKGKMNYYNHNKNGVCFKCNGEGVIFAEAKDVIGNVCTNYNFKPEHVKENFLHKPFKKFAEGVYVPYIRNTYNEKDKLKAAGFKWSYDFGWHLTGKDYDLKKRRDRKGIPADYHKSIPVVFMPADDMFRWDKQNQTYHVDADCKSVAEAIREDMRGY